MVVLRPIFGLAPHTFPVDTHEVSEYRGGICVALDILVLIQIFGTSTTHIPSGHT